MCLYNFSFFPPCNILKHLFLPIRFIQGIYTWWPPPGQYGGAQLCQAASDNIWFLKYLDSNHTHQSQDAFRHVQRPADYQLSLLWSVGNIRRSGQNSVTNFSTLSWNYINTIFFAFSFFKIFYLYLWTDWFTILFYIVFFKESDFFC